MRSPERLGWLAAALVAAACGSGTAPGGPAGAPGEPGSPSPPLPEAPVVVGSGTGRSPLEGSVTGARAILVSVDRGLYLLDPALAGEPRLEGEVYVSVDGAAPPGDTRVEINGVPLVRRELPGSPESPFSVDAAGPQPEPDAEGRVTITVRSGELMKTMTLPCPPDLAVTSSVPPDSRVRGRRAIELSWDGELEPNAGNPFPTAFTTSAKLMHYSYATHAVGDAHYATEHLPDGARRVDLAIAPSDDGYCAELRWQGRYVQAGNSRGFCGRAKRIEYRY